ncbi:hypothetical protein RCOM_1434920 [Ricinus communis]|uniref:TRF2/HOY1 PH-like domain-containing protein n=1 Tax=Ricinus communis TaxID=3988 RepID=B9RFI7_RICCO|nr:hypothetical protein RCOM_1434920 [Ricinus communis]
MADEQLGGSRRNLFWSHGGAGGDGPFGSRMEFPDEFFGFGNSENNRDYCTEAANKRIIETLQENSEEAEVADVLLRLRPFGLKLSLTSSLVESVDMNLNHPKHAAAKSCHPHPKVDDYGSQPISEKLKASNFSASLLKIGTWERRSKNEGDLVAKCYYAKKKLVWEFLEKGLKSKIEIQWNDIIALKAHIQENEPGILEIELSQAPTFHEETDPQPRKHTIWRLTSDFTRGQASTFRRHYLVFPPGALDRHYEKLLQCDHRLYGLSQRPFPSLESLYFEPCVFNYPNFFFNYHGERQFNFSGIPSPLMAVHYGQYEQTPPQLSFKQTHSPISVMDFSHSDEQINHNVFENPRMSIWSQVVNNNVIDSSAASIPFHHANPPASSYLNFNNPSAFDQGEGSNLLNNMLLNNLAEHLLSDAQVEGYDEKYHMARVASLNALVNMSQEANRASEDSVQQTFHEQEMCSDDAMVFSGNEQASVISDYQQQQSLSCMSLQACYPNAMMHQDQAGNHLSYSPLSPDSMMEEFGHISTVDQLKRWT